MDRKTIPEFKLCQYDVFSRAFIFKLHNETLQMKKLKKAIEYKKSSKKQDGNVKKNNHGNNVGTRGCYFFASLGNFDDAGITSITKMHASSEPGDQLRCVEVRSGITQIVRTESRPSSPTIQGISP